MTDGGRLLVYLAGPLFSHAERTFNEGLTTSLEEADFSVFLPQRDGVSGFEPTYDTMTREERRQTMFYVDRSKIKEAEIFLFVLDGRVPDEGACVELGMAYCYKELDHENKLLIGLRTDSRAAFSDSPLNPMVRVPLEYVVHDEGTLMQMLIDHRTRLCWDQ